MCAIIISQSEVTHVIPTGPKKTSLQELLEMTEDTEMSEWGTGQRDDGIPSDIESGWVAVTPVPAGKRCLAITHAPSGITGLGES